MTEHMVRFTYEIEKNKTTDAWRTEVSKEQVKGEEGEKCFTHLVTGKREVQ